MKPAPVDGAATKIAVRLLHKDPLLRMGVLAALRSDPRFEVRVEGRWPDAGGSDLSGMAVPAFPALSAGDVVVADYDSALAILANAAGTRATPRIMVVTQRQRETEIRQAMEQGVLGYVLIGCSLQEIFDGVLAISRGQRHLGHQAARLVAENYMHQSLTGREEEVLGLLVVGWSNKMIANELDIAVGTIKSHVKAILGKLDASTRTEAAAVALRRGLVGQEPVDRPLPGRQRAARRQGRSEVHAASGAG